MHVVVKHVRSLVETDETLQEMFRGFEKNACRLAFFRVSDKTGEDLFENITVNELLILVILSASDIWLS